MMSWPLRLERFECFSLVISLATGSKPWQDASGANLSDANRIIRVLVMVAFEMYLLTGPF
jgi:hypothetical protein